MNFGNNATALSICIFLKHNEAAKACPDDRALETMCLRAKVFSSFTYRLTLNPTPYTLNLNICAVATIEGTLRKPRGSHPGNTGGGGGVESWGTLCRGPCNKHPFMFWILYRGISDFSETPMSGGSGSCSQHISKAVILS